jgi:DMSO/TMAO reductase YedYZ molybdopterin-dependent catalytic subunit
MKGPEEYISQKQINRRTIFGLVMFILFLSGCVLAWLWLHNSNKESGTPAPLRSVLNKNEALFSRTLSDGQLAKTYPKEYAAKKVRVNGLIGLQPEYDTANWSLQVIRKPGDTLLLTIKDIRSLPKTEIVFDFKCIEGWSQVSYWGGVRFIDFVKHYGLTDQARLAYAGLSTPDNKYYVGIDMKSMMHPQTLLCYEMNGQALPLKQGAPLRLIIPVKYGVKHLKRIGTLFFSNQRPPDYWYERGYDYFCGL